MKVLIMRGIPGSGKSSYVRHLGCAKVVCSADHYFTRDGAYRFDPEQLDAAHRFCLRAFFDAVRRGKDLVVVDNTNTHAYEISAYRAIAFLHGYEVDIVRTACEPVMAFQRNTHGVPLEDIVRMHENMEQLPLDWTETVVTTE